jgi:hypothetical protein
MESEEKILQLTKQLYPRSRAFKLFAGSYFERLHIALAKSETRAINDSLAILYAILPDNDNFTAADGTDWERRLGLISNPDVELSLRKLAILRKMNHPGTIKARQHYLYIQGQLQAAGFDVYVYENLDGALPESIISNQGLFGDHGEYEHGQFEHGDVYSVFNNLFIPPEHGEMDHGSFEHNEFVYANKVVNNIFVEGDSFFNDGATSRAVFFIGGNPLGTFASVPLARRNEFRQLILKLKPVQNVGYLLINYT